MFFRKTFALFISVICLFTLIVSYFLWTEKLENSQKESKIVQNDQMNKELAEEQSFEYSRDQVVEALHNVDEQIKHLVLNRYDKNESVQMLIIGSTVMQNGNPGYGQKLSEAITNTYGNLFDVTLSPWDTNSDVFVQTHLEEIQWDKGFDLILMEPFTLNNNGQVKIEEEHNHIRKVQDKSREQVDDALIVLQPPHPFYKAQFYLKQVTALEAFAATNNIPYINHWHDWPGTDDIAITEFLTEDNIPNNDGADLWSSFLIHYFTN